MEDHLKTMWPDGSLPNNGSWGAIGFDFGWPREERHVHINLSEMLMPCKSSCAVYCIQWNTSKKAVGIPPRLISFVPALCDWRWLGSCPPYAGF